MISIQNKKRCMPFSYRIYIIARIYMYEVPGSGRPRPQGGPVLNSGIYLFLHELFSAQCLTQLAVNCFHLTLQQKHSSQQWNIWMNYYTWYKKKKYFITCIDLYYCYPTVIALLLQTWSYLILYNIDKWSIKKLFL